MCFSFCSKHQKEWKTICKRIHLWNCFDFAFVFMKQMAIRIRNIWATFISKYMLLLYIYIGKSFSFQLNMKIVVGKKWIVGKFSKCIVTHAHCTHATHLYLIDLWWTFSNTLNFTYYSQLFTNKIHLKYIYNDLNILKIFFFVATNRFDVAEKRNKKRNNLHTIKHERVEKSEFKVLCWCFIDHKVKDSFCVKFLK